MTPTEHDKNELWDTVSNYIKEKRVHCPEATCEDRVYESCPEFIESLADIVGYAELED